jgi:3'(2'), 5'-bisphosphate nucleotidase
MEPRTGRPVRDLTAPEDDHALATRLATAAGELLVGLRAELAAESAHAWEIMDAGDLAAHRFLMAELAAARPDDGVLSEEGRDDRRRVTVQRVWIVDPLDGTNEFGEPGRRDWAVHVALAVDGRLGAAAVALPALDRTFATRPAPAPLPPLDGRRPRAVVSRTRATRAAVLAADAVGAEVLRLGSAGAKAMAVVTGDADLYVHSGGMYEWDSAAPAAVAMAAGLHASRLDGSPLLYNRPDPWLPDLLICRPELAQPVITALQG